MSTYKDFRLSPDTSPEAEQILFELLAKKSPAEKLKMVSQLTVAVRRLALSGLRQRYPEDSDVKLKVRLSDQLYGTDIAQAVATKLIGSQPDE